jgi:hypothetical protein
MNCEDVSTELKALLDNELSPIQAWYVKAHLASCRPCTAEWSLLKQLDHVLESSDYIKDSEELSSYSDLTNNSVRIVRAGTLALALTVIACVFLALSISRFITGNDNAAIASSIETANTWHLVGWKQIGGVHIPWEIWGRRKPFLNEERVGNDITVDDGHLTRRYYAPAPSQHRPYGLEIVINDSISSSANWLSVEPTVQSMVDGWDWSRGGGIFSHTPFHRTISEEIYRQQAPWGITDGVNCNQLFTIDRFTKLPVRYQLHYDSRTMQWDTEFLSCKYNVPLPNSLSDNTFGARYRTVDLRNPGTSSVTVEPKLMGVDSKGNILLRYKASLGGNLILPSSLFSGEISEPDDASDLPFAVNGSHKFVYLYSSLYKNWSPDDHGFVYELCSPLVPSQSSTILPRTFRFDLDVSPTVAIETTDQVYPEYNNSLHVIGRNFNRTTTNETLFTKLLSETIQLPTKPTVKSILSILPQSDHWEFQRQQLDIQVDEQRAFYYKVASPVTVLREFKKAHEQQELTSIYWERQIIELCRKSGDKDGEHNALRVLASYYQDVNDRAKMHQTLFDAVVAAKRSGETLPAKQDEYTLRTGIFPWDSTYRGPS